MRSKLLVLILLAAIAMFSAHSRDAKAADGCDSGTTYSGNCVSEFHCVVDGNCVYEQYTVCCSGRCFVWLDLVDCVE